MRHLDAREFLESLWKDGNEFADEIMDAFDLVNSGEHAESVNVLDDLRKLCPDDWKKPVDPWHVNEWICERLDMLDSVKEMLADKRGLVTGDPDDNVRDELATLESAEEILRDCGHWVDGEFLDALQRLAERNPQPYDL